MEPLAIARYALDWYKDPDLAIIATAINIAESNGDPNAEGDKAEGPLAPYAAFACHGFLSFGLGQVFLGVHHDMIETMSGETLPCGQAEWLKDPDNNFRAQTAIHANQGWRAWSTFGTKPYLDALSEARLAIAELTQLQPPLNPPPEPPHTIEPTIPKSTALRLRWRMQDTTRTESFTNAEEIVIRMEQTIG